MARTNIKTAEEISAMREAGKLAAQVLREGSLLVMPGARTGEIDREIGKRIHGYGGVSAFYRYRVFLASAASRSMRPLSMESEMIGS